MKIKEPLSRIIDMLSNLISKFNIPVTIAVIMLFIITVNAHSQSGWFSQPLPVNGQVQDLKFFDANTGLILMNEPFRIFRTTNGGYHWDSTIHNQYITLIDVIDSTSVYGVGAFANGSKQIIRSYDRGLTWDSMAVTVLETINGLSFVNRDTGWIGGTSGGLPFLWRTTNAGVTWTVQSNDTGFGIIFFLKNKVNREYIGWSMNYSDLWKTTNSGMSWTQIQQSFGISKLYFSEENIGYVSAGDKFKKTTNGGMNWSTYSMPTNYNIFINTINNLKFINKDTIYGDNGNRLFGSTLRGIIWISTNGGVNWGFQQPDTSIHQGKYYGIEFANKDTGWSSWIRTNDGGGPIIISGINNHVTNKPELFILEQNYPNPFNSSTRINFSISKPSFISLTIYDITGKEVLKVYNNEFFTSGNYYTGLNIGGMGLSSGVYVYRMRASDIKSNNVFEQSRKLVYIK